GDEAVVEKIDEGRVIARRVALDGFRVGDALGAGLRLRDGRHRTTREITLDQLARRGMRGHRDVKQRGRAAGEIRNLVREAARDGDVVERPDLVLAALDV